MKPLQILYLELTNNCNCSCLTCPKSLKGINDRPKGYMDFNLFCRLVDQAYELTDALNISYFGEHSLHPRFTDFMDFLGKRRGMGVTLYSNFLNITKKHIDSIINARLENLSISVDAANSSVYDVLRRGNTCVDLEGKVCDKNRLEIVEEKIRYWLGRNDHPATRFEFTVSHHNINEVKPFVEKWSPLLSDSDCIFTKVVLTYGGHVLNEPFLLENSCGIWEGKVLVVTWDGKIGPCYLDTNMELCLGNINEQTLSSMINSNRYNEIKLLSKNKLISPCKDCKDASNRKMDRTFRKNNKWTEECDNYLRLFNRNM